MPWISWFRYIFILAEGIEAGTPLTVRVKFDPTTHAHFLTPPVLAAIPTYMCIRCEFWCVATSIPERGMKTKGRFNDHPVLQS